MKVFSAKTALPPAKPGQCFECRKRISDRPVNAELRRKFKEITGRNWSKGIILNLAADFRTLHIDPTFVPALATFCLPCSVAYMRVFNRLNTTRAKVQNACRSNGTSMANITPEEKARVLESLELTESDVCPCCQPALTVLPDEIKQKLVRLIRLFVQRCEARGERNAVRRDYADLRAELMPVFLPIVQALVAAGMISVWRDHDQVLDEPCKDHPHCVPCSWDVPDVFDGDGISLILGRATGCRRVDTRAAVAAN
jgi:hypothetical protein